MDAPRFICKKCKGVFDNKDNCEFHEGLCKGREVGKSATLTGGRTGSSGTLNGRTNSQISNKSAYTQSDRSLSSAYSSGGNFQFLSECQAPKCCQHREELTSKLTEFQSRSNAMIEEQLLEQVRQLEAEMGDLQSKQQKFIKPTQPPLEALGPFSAKRNVRVKLRTVEKVVKGTDGVNGTLYEVTGPKPIVKLCKQINLSTLGTLSPLGEITLPKDQWAGANIPKDASMFAFAYPLAGVSQLNNDELQSFSDNDLHKFVTIGGYVYFTAQGEVLQVNAIDMGPGIFFDGPHALPMTALVELQKQGRMQPVSAGALRDTGAEFFCCMRPGEETTLKGLPKSVENGAFAYNYGGDGTKNRYFRVVPEEQATQGRPVVQPGGLTVTKDTGTDDSALSSTLCHRCAVRNVNCVFLPCKHMACCKDCAEGIKKCPMCERGIRMKIEVFC